MSGIKNGLQALFKFRNPHLIYIGCKNHCMALVFTHSEKEFPIMREFTKLMYSMFGVYDDSSLRRDIRKDLYFNLTRCVAWAPIKAIVTRWLTFSPQNKNIVNHYELEVEALQERFRFSSLIQRLTASSMSHAPCFVPYSL